jgi:acyl-CoA thioesterase FadM
LNEAEVRRGEELLTEAEVHLVCVSLASFKPASVPEVLRKQLNK